MPKDLLVPGTSGNKLMLDGADLGWPSALLAQGWLAGATGFALGLDGLPLTAKAIVEVLCMRYADPASVLPTSTTLKEGAAISPGPVLDAVYNQFLGFERFIYDFRSDIRQSGQRLLTYLLENRPAGERWRLVCHSQGGLVATVASKLWARQNGDDDRAFADLCSHLAFVATPFYGTLTAAAALLEGTELSPGFASHFRAIARTWPALHQMLPVWPGSVRFKEGAEVKNAPFNALDPRAWQGAEIDLAMLQRARETRTQFLNSPLSRMNGVKVRLLMSRAWPTANHLVLENGVVSVGSEREPGDTLVPASTTFAMEAEVEKNATHLFGTDRDTLKHGPLCVDPFVAAEVTSFFNQ